MSTAMIAITTSNSISVKPRLGRRFVMMPLRDQNNGGPGMRESRKGFSPGRVAGRSRFSNPSITLQARSAHRPTCRCRHFSAPSAARPGITPGGSHTRLCRVKPGDGNGDAARIDVGRGRKRGRTRKPLETRAEPQIGPKVAHALARRADSPGVLAQSDVTKVRTGVPSAPTRPETVTCSALPGLGLPSMRVTELSLGPYFAARTAMV